MKNLNYLYQALEEKISNQCFYNEMSVRVANPAASALFTRLRDAEAAHVRVLQKEILAAEAKPIPINKILQS